ncbi:cytidylyltransferase domain-containing protein [Flavobacterium sp. HJJ]|uniref:acylneuraminate cytidylyltransferase family protein n=1 Tax=Flavobacterium sp. HJJ TaxID=2783792 RepID=UPI001889EBB6|nr:acylneuraminate cytidylyltransferase family protein [Flavobacterium sp. HJJ]MBF4470308.1 acylneuraminate cytidylyltransferase family protein [Flavobacterium sp. HJJ]
MRVLAIIPARGGSKGVPGKNSKLLGGKPLIAYSIEQAIASNSFAKIIVSTDDEAIAQIAIDFGAEVPFIRPSELANDTASSIDVVQHTIGFLASKNEFFDAVCLLQPTSPFREKGFITKAISKFSSTDSDALVSVLPVPHEYNPHWIFQADTSGMLQIATGDKEIIKRRQELPQAFFRDGAIYLTKLASIKKGTFYGEKLSYIESNPYLYVNIDTMEDWIQAEQKLPTILSLI